MFGHLDPLFWGLVQNQAPGDVTAGAPKSSDHVSDAKAGYVYRDPSVQRIPT